MPQATEDANIRCGGGQVFAFYAEIYTLTHTNNNKQTAFLRTQQHSLAS